MKNALSGRSRGSKLLRVLFYTIGAVFLLIVAAIFALSLPAVQQSLTVKTANYLRTKLGTRVEVGAIPLRFPLDISLVKFLLEGPQGDMLAQVVDTVVVVDGTILLDNILGAQAVLNHKQRLLITVVQVVERNAEAQWIDGPAPLALLQVGVLGAGEGVALGALDIGVIGTGGATGAVIAKADEVDGVGGQDLAVLVRHTHIDA